MIRYLTCLTLALFALPAWGQSSSDEKTEWFTVELIVFEQAGDRGVPPPDPYVPDTANAVNLEEELERAGAPEGPARLLLPLPDAIRFLPAPPGAGTLDDAWEKLENSPYYRPILRMSWRQRVGAFSNPVPVRVQGGEVLAYRDAAEAGPTLAEGGSLPAAGLPEGASKARVERAVNEVDGSLALVRGRYLHFNVDLVFRERETPLVTRGVSGAYGTDSVLTSFPTWRITESREIKPGQIHYFDHRRFGAIAVATPWLAPAPAGSAPAPDGERFLPESGNALPADTPESPESNGR